MLKEKLKKISENVYELPKEGAMNVPGRIYFSDEMIEHVEEDSLKQVSNVAKLPGIINQSIGLADMHVGYGFPIGGVAAFDLEEGVISPGGVGYDINCSVRLLKTNLTKEDIIKNQEKILSGLSRKIPSGVGRGSPYQIKRPDFMKVLKQGAKQIVEMHNGKIQVISKGRNKGSTFIIILPLS